MGVVLDWELMNTSSDLVMQVAAKAAIVDGDGRILIVREAPTGKNNTKVGKWGLVGGRLEPGETFEAGLKREVKEEVGLDVEPLKPIYVGEWRPVIRGVPHQIIAIFMEVTVVGGDIRLSVEHDEAAWIDPRKRQDYLMMEPDCFVVDDMVRLR